MLIRRPPATSLPISTFTTGFYHIDSEAGRSMYGILTVIDVNKMESLTFFQASNI
jgi:hypothetical protein